VDNAVALVESYLRVNGYFTVTEFPVVEATVDTGYREAADLDLLAFRFPGAGRLILGASNDAPDYLADPAIDPELGIDVTEADMIVGEVKEGLAEFNRAGRRPSVIAAGLARFGCCSSSDASLTADRLVQKGEALTAGGHRVRLVAFGGAVGEQHRPYLTISLGHVVRFLETYLEDHWEVLRHTQSKDPVLGFLMALAKARR
jgi:hypothetical protein